MIDSGMRFPMPNHPCDFEVPDDWLAEADFFGFQPRGPAFRSLAGATEVEIARIQPPHRNANVIKHWRGMDRQRLVSILRVIAAHGVIEAVEGRALAEEEFPSAAYTHRVLDGYHRFYASVAAGFTALPMRLR